MNNPGLRNVTLNLSGSSRSVESALVLANVTCMVIDVASCPTNCTDEINYPPLPSLESSSTTSTLTTSSMSISFSIWSPSLKCLELKGRANISFVNSNFNSPVCDRIVWLTSSNLDLFVSSASKIYFCIEIEIFWILLCFKASEIALIVNVMVLVLSHSSSINFEILSRLRVTLRSLSWK